MTDLALVLARVVHPRVPNLQRPDVVAVLVEGGEPGVRGHAVVADGEDGQVATADPRNLNDGGISERYFVLHQSRLETNGARISRHSATESFIVRGGGACPIRIEPGKTFQSF